MDSLRFYVHFISKLARRPEETAAVVVTHKTSSPRPRTRQKGNDEKVKRLFFEGQKIRG